jgi:diguanylate cyclase (GGDEF)-like protein
MGYLHLDSDQSDNFTAEHQMMAQLYGHLIGITLFREDLAEGLKRLEYRDGDSGAVKYAHFFSRLQELFHQAERLQDPLSVILIDIAGYSGILKTYGIGSTQQMLRELVDSVNSNLRRYDGLSRFGTDEFMVTLPGTRLHESKKAGEKLRGYLINKEFTPQKLKINFFIALANYPENCSTLDGLLTATRHALLEAKRSNLINSVVTLKQIVD